jgi:hypothetical protein
MDTLQDIPYLCQNDATSPSTFEEFVEKCTQISTGTIDNERCSDEALALLARHSQSCLWFGLLAIILENRFAREDFVLPSSAASFIKTDSASSTICKHITREKFVESNGEDEELSIYQFHLVEALRSACKVINAVIIPAIQQVERTGCTGTREVCDAGIYKVFLSIAILVELIHDHLEALSLGINWALPDRVNFTHETFGITHIYRSGWCPSIPKRLGLKSHEAVRLFNCRPGVGSKDHSNCSKDYCGEFNVDKATYRTKHTQQGCLCGEFLGVDRHQLIEIINSGQIPLISSSMDSQGNVSIKLVKGNLTNRYTAISHVWAGGLGNFRENALPRCQLEQLHRSLENNPPNPVDRTAYIQVQLDLLRWVKRLVQRIAHRFLFSRFRKTSTKLYWLDTLCIPTKPAQHGQRLNPSDNNTIPEYIRRAIDSMAQIYTGATEVLVLDPQLQDMQISELDPQDADLMICSSPWMARSWTLHEGAVAVNVRIKFADTVQSYVDIAQRGTLLAASGVQKIWSEELMGPNNPDQPESLLSFGRHLLEDVFFFDPMPRDDSSRDPSDCLRFVTAWNALASRTTSEPADVAGIFASLLHLSAGEVLGITSKNLRMKALLKSQKRLPVSLLFAPMSNNSQEWVPAFPEASQVFCKLDMSLGYMTVTTSGLVIEGPLRLILCQPKVSTSGPFLIHDRRRNEMIRVSFPDNASKASISGVGSHVLLLSSLSDSIEGSKGLLCTFVRDEGAMHVTPLRPFVWRHEYHGNPNSKANPLKCFSIDNPIDSNYVGTEHPLVINLGKGVSHVSNRALLTVVDIESWPTLQWSRLRAFPFVELGLGQEQLLDLYPILTIFPWLMTLGSLTFFTLVSLLFQSLGLRTLIQTILFTGFALIARWMSSLVEYDYMRCAEYRLIQRKWASSYITSVHEPATATRTSMSSLRRIAKLPFPGFIFVALSAYVAVLPLLLFGVIRGMHPFLQTQYPFLHYPEWWTDMVSAAKRSPTSLPILIVCWNLLVENVLRIVVCTVYVFGFMRAHAKRDHVRRDPSRWTPGQQAMAAMIWAVQTGLLMSMYYFWVQFTVALWRSAPKGHDYSGLFIIAWIVVSIVTVLVSLVGSRPFWAGFWPILRRRIRCGHGNDGEIRLV